MESRTTQRDPPTSMPSNPRAVAGLIFLCAACSRTTEPTPSLSKPLAPGTLARFTGEVVLVGALAHTTDGAVEISVRPIGGKDAIWSRSYEVRDPWWTGGPNRRSLPFGVSKADSVDASGPTAADGTKTEIAQPVSEEMEVVVRFDPDGDPDTSEPGDIELVTRARTGATDLVLTLGGPPANLRAGPDLSQTQGGLAPPVEPRHPR
jgi:hypothetical protein